MARRFSIVLIVALLVLAALPVSAGTNSGAVFDISCEGFTSSSGSILLDRDNTGQSSEAFIVSATDGAGNIIYEPKQDSFFVGGSVAWTGNTIYLWTAQPAFNPITLRIVSPAGNGQPEQLIALATGSCAELPGYGVLPGNVFVVEGDTLTVDGRVVVQVGATSPSVDPNAVPPRPVNAPDLSDDLPGYLLVNTDNLSLRSGDGPDYTLVGIVDGGTVLVPLGRNHRFTWWYVQAGDLIGWAKAEFLIARGNLTDVPAIEALGELAPVTFALFADAELKANPRSSALPLCTIAGNLEYDVVGRNRAGTWFQVQASCDNAVVNGWLDATLGALRNPAEVQIPVAS